MENIFLQLWSKVDREIWMKMSLLIIQIQHEIEKEVAREIDI